MPLAPNEVVQLVERFERNRDSYKNPAYNETQVRREFIDPLFKALGWDVDNEQGLAEAYKDVIHEDAINVGGVTKAPDYCFRIGGTRKFFLEAKKPAVPLKEHTEPAYQLRRYAWSARLPLSILTDFEELAVYDCRIRPHKNDKPSQARTMYFTYDQYADRWAELAAIFSKDAVLKGSFDKYAESARRKKGTAEVDTEFLSEIESWRELLARNFALRNPVLSVRDLNFAVQRTIDRLIFLRLCEDRGIEPYGQLQALCATNVAAGSRTGRMAQPSPAVTDAGKLYQRLGELFRRADEKYNSSLFYFTPEAGREPPDELTLGLKLDDKVLNDILGRLYYPESPYEFSVLPPEILGQVYEQFLGKVIRLTKGHQARVEDKPEVKKAGGVYYTPSYIVDYIVKNTVGKLLEGKTPPEVGPDRDQSAKRKRGVETRAGAARCGPVAHARGSVRGRGSVRPLRILDPACGSGSFLLGAYQYLLDWHRDFYVNAVTGGAITDQSPDRKGGVDQSPERERRATSDGAGVPPADSTGCKPVPQGSAGVSPAELKRYRDRIYQGPGGQWRLTVQEKKRILLNNIYGVDIDPQAVEVTKLSLLLKVLENESAETVGQTLRLFHERALPDLSNNIKCGNSLIGPDFYEGRQLSMFDEEQRLRINVFDWHAEFPEVFVASGPRPGRLDPNRARKKAVMQEQNRARKKAVSPRRRTPLAEGGRSEEPLSDGRGSVEAPDPSAGFDVVIGNPPYIRIQNLKEFAPLEAEFYKQRYKAASKGNFDIYVLFVERGLWLLNYNGRLGMILPHKFFNAKYGQALRKMIAGGKHLVHVVHFADQQVFAGATTYTCLLFLHKAGRHECRVVKVHDLPAWRTGAPTQEGAIAADRIAGEEWNFYVGKAANLLDKLREMRVRLGDLAERIAQGIRTSANEVYVLDLVSERGDLIEAYSKELDGTVLLERKAVKLFLQGREIKPYRILASGKVVVIPYQRRGQRIELISAGEYRARFPETFAYLLKNRDVLESRERGRMRGRTWYGYVYPKNIEIMSAPKILVPDIADRASFALDESGNYAFTSGYGITLHADVVESPKYLLGLLNSKVLDFFLKKVSTTLRGGFFRYFTQYVEQLPVRRIDFPDPGDKSHHDRMVALVQQMLDLHKQLSAATTPTDKTAIQRQIDATDRQIDRLVYELNELTDEEIGIVEEATRA